MFGSCSICGEPLSYVAYQLLFIVILASDGETTLELEEATEIIAKYCNANMYHLSATELILYRPDEIIKAFQKEYKERKIESWAFLPTDCCEKCYELQKQKHPVK
jgi:hypothetical protein